MSKIISIEPQINPHNRLSFLLDWEITLKCNLDCSYCTVGIGHDNSTKHPNLEECLRTIDFMYEYTDLYMKNKIQSLKHVILNIYGGEALFHKDIIKILKSAKEKYEKYQKNWKLTIATTTNATVSSKKLDQLMNFIDNWTCSFHTESSTKHKEQFKQNLLKLKEKGKHTKVIVLMHSDPKKFAEAQLLIDWCLKNKIDYLPRQLDHGFDKRFYYNNSQIQWFENVYNSKNKSVKFIEGQDNNLSNVGRSCCGGRTLVKNNNQHEKFSFVNNKLFGWKCSVNHFFLNIKQITGEVRNNRDCRLTLDGNFGPIGVLSDTNKILDDAKQFIEKKDKSYITCTNDRCWCGLCSPKARTEKDYQEIFRKYINEKT